MALNSIDLKKNTLYKEILCLRKKSKGKSGLCVPYYFELARVSMSEKRLDYLCYSDEKKFPLVMKIKSKILLVFSSILKATSIS